MEAVRGAAVAGDKAAFTRLWQIQPRPPPPGLTAASVDASHAETLFVAIYQTQVPPSWDTVLLL